MQKPNAIGFVNKVTLRSLGILIAFALQTVAISQEKAERFFTDQSGNFRIKASIIDLNETHVSLRKSDGNEVTVEIGKLSDRDQKYLNDAYKKYKAMVGDYPIGTNVEIFSTGGWHPGEIISVQPGKYYIKFDKYSETWNKWVTVNELRLRTPGDESADAMPSSSKSVRSQNSLAIDRNQTSTANSKTILPDLNKALAAAPVIDLRTASVAKAAFESDPIPNFGKSLPLPQPFSVTAERIGLPMQARFDSTMQYVAIDPVNFSGPHTVTIVPLDKSRPQWNFSTYWKLAGITDNAQSVLFLDDVVDAVYFRIALNSEQTNFTVSEGNAWLPCSNHNSREHHLPGNRLLVETLHEVQLWDLESRRVSARFTGGKDCQISGQGRYVACKVAQDTIVIFDTRNFEVTHRFRIDNWKPLNLSFDPSGSRLAVTGVGQGQVYDLSTGEILHAYSLTNGNSGEMGINWIGRRFLVLLGGSIVDLESGLPVWSFPFDRQPLLQFDENTIGAVSGSGTTATVDWFRITPEQLAKLADVDTSNAVVIPSGAIATLDVSGLRHYTQEVKTYFESSLQSLGYTLGPNGTLEIRFSSTIGSPQRIRLKDFMRVNKDLEASFTPATVTRQILLNGIPIYDFTEEFGERQLKSTLTIQPNESAQDAVTRLTTPSKSLFTTIDIPRAGGTFLPRAKALIGEGTLKDLSAKVDARR